MKETGFTVDPFIVVVASHFASTFPSYHVYKWFCFFVSLTVFSHFRFPLSLLPYCFHFLIFLSLHPSLSIRTLIPTISVPSLFCLYLRPFIFHLALESLVLYSVLLFSLFLKFSLFTRWNTFYFFFTSRSEEHCFCFMCCYRSYCCSIRRVYH